MKKLSQEEAEKVLKGMKVKSGIPKAAVTQWKRNTALDMAIEALKYSEFPNNSDTISRQAVIDAIDRFNCCGYVEEKFDRLAEAINVLPSAQPEIIHCSNCRFFKRNIPCVDGHYNGCEMWLDDGDEIRVMTDDYCSKALPKEGEQE